MSNIKFRKIVGTRVYFNTITCTLNNNTTAKTINAQTTPTSPHKSQKSLISSTLIKSGRTIDDEIEEGDDLDLDSNES